MTILDIDPDISGFTSVNSSYPDNFVEFNDQLFFTVDDELFFGADNGEIGTELFKLTFDDSDANIYAIASGNSGDIITEFI